MVEWRRVKLNEVCREITVGHVGPMADKYIDDGIPFLRSLSVEPFRISREGLKFIDADFHAKLKKSALQPGDVVIVRTGKPGACAVIPDWLEDANCSDLVIARCGPRLRPRFLCYVVNSVAGQHIDDHLVGAVQQHFNVGSARTLEFGLPDLNEQDEILALLGSLDDKIELNRRMNATLEAMARAIFKDWFVDFGPARAKAEGRPPYLAPDLWALFPDTLDDDDKPMGWEFSTLAAVAALNPETWSRANAPEAIEYVDLANTKWGVIESTQRHMWAKAPSRAQRIIRPGDTIVGTVRPGNGSYAFVGDDGLTGSTGFAALRPLHVRFREFVYLAATSAENIERLSHLADGAAYPAVRPDVVAETDVTLPSNSVMDSFSRLIAPLVERWEVNKRENQTLAHTRDLLLPKLMSGEIRLRDAEKAVEAVA